MKRKRLLLIIACVFLLGCGKKELSKEQLSEEVPVKKEFREKLYGTILETHEMEGQERLQDASGKTKENHEEQREFPSDLKRKSKENTNWQIKN